MPQHSRNKSTVATSASQATQTLSNGTVDPAISYAMEIQRKYQEERTKRLKAEGNSQFIDLGKDTELSSKFKHFQKDPWVKSDGTPINTAGLQDASRVKALILGAGFGGLQFAVGLIKQGFCAEDIRIADSAGGFGGTWYWNRYPGLMCDVESYIYMPFLEEMDWMPKYKYAYGPELREYANAIAAKYDLADKAMFQTEIKTQIWDDNEKEWITKMVQRPEGREPVHLEIRSQYIITSPGVLNFPKVPDVPGLGTYQGHSFHTSRWDYDYTGGSPSDPSLTNLKDKVVGIIGTGATAIQSIPHLAKWAKHLYVFQRTPSAVDTREQLPTDVNWWNTEIRGNKGWQRERMKNFNQFIANDPEKPTVDMVHDNWTRMPTYSAQIGGPSSKGVTMENIAQYISSLHAMDMPRQERIRARVDSIVKDKDTAQKLKAWYPGWCKRPCFHDDYLPTFNLPNVTLVDTDGKGIEGLAEKAVIVAGKEYPVDLLIFSTGFRSPVKGDEGLRANLSITGRNGETLVENWKNGVSTLHGVTTKGFPNMFWPGPLQGPATANFNQTLAVLSTHVAYIISQAERQAEPGKKVLIESTSEAEQQWGTEIMIRALALAGMARCTPGYINAEGELDRLRSQEEQMKAARGSIWGEGIESYIKVVEAWRADGQLKGIQVSVVA